MEQFYLPLDARSKAVGEAKAKGAFKPTASPPKRNFAPTCPCGCSHEGHILLVPDDEARDWPQCSCTGCGPVHVSGSRRCAVKIHPIVWLMGARCGECRGAAGRVVDHDADDCRAEARQKKGSRKKKAAHSAAPAGVEDLQDGSAVQNEEEERGGETEDGGRGVHICDADNRRLLAEEMFSILAQSLLERTFDAWRRGGGEKSGQDVECAPQSQVCNRSLDKTCAADYAWFVRVKSVALSIRLTVSQCSGCMNVWTLNVVCVFVCACVCVCECVCCFPSYRVWVHVQNETIITARQCINAHVA
jgi:hypothetical protein